MDNCSNSMLDLTILWSQNGWPPTSFLCPIYHISFETLLGASILQKWSILPIIWNFFVGTQYCSKVTTHRGILDLGTLISIKKKLLSEIFGIWGYNTWKVSLLPFLARELFFREECWPSNPMSLRQDFTLCHRICPSMLGANQL